MSFLSPFPLVLGALAAAAVVAFHLLTTRRPPPLVLPTARFVPVAEARAVARASRPTDLVLLALRALAVLLLGAAFARPVIDAPGPSVRTVVLLEDSRAVSDSAEAAERAREAVGDAGADAGAVVRFGSLSAAFVAARAEAARIAPGADSMRLVVVSSFTDRSFDAATPALRAGWPGRVELLRVAAVTDTARGAEAGLRTPLDDDPLAPTIAALGGIRGGDGVRIQREALTAADSAWARAGDRVLLAWPARFDESVAPAAVIAFGEGTPAVVAPFARLTLPSGDARDGASSDRSAGGDRVLARWNDGAPAVVQQPLGAGCVRHVGIGVPLAGDITLRAPFARLLDVLTEPCDGRVGTVVPDSSLTWLAGEAGSALAPARLVAADDDTRSSRLPAVLLALALTLLVAEQVLRRRGAE